MLVQKQLRDWGGQFLLIQHRQIKRLLLIDAQPQVSVQRDLASAVLDVAVILEQHSFPGSVERRDRSPSIFYSVGVYY